MNEESEVEVVRFYTRARRIQQVIGSTPTGARIPGGPYPLTAAAGFAVVLVLGWQTMGLWATDDFLVNVVILSTAAVSTLFALKRIPAGSKSPIVAATGMIQAMSLPSWGKLAGRPLRIDRLRAAPRARRDPFTAQATAQQTPSLTAPPTAATTGTTVLPAAPPVVGVDVQSLMDAAAARASRLVSAHA